MRRREPLGYDLFGQPYYEDPAAAQEPEKLPEFTRATLPRHFRTWQQILDSGLEPVGPPVGRLSYGALVSKSVTVYDERRARVPQPREPDMFDACEEEPEPAVSRGILVLATWSPWVPLIGAEVPRSPGVYLARRGANGPVVYVGKAGERKDGGLRGRLRRYTSGKALASGLGEAVFDRALADRDWLRERLAEVEDARPMRATGWGKAALTWADLHICWALSETGEEAVALEKKILAMATTDWWNRAR